MLIEKIINVRLLYYSISYTKFPQLWHRLKLKVKRNILSRIVSKPLKRKLSKATLENLTRSVVQIPRIFPARHEFVEPTENRTAIKFLNVSRSLPVDLSEFDWRPLELQFGTRLWLLNLHYHEFLEGLSVPIQIQLILNWIQNVLPYERQYWMDTWNSYSLSIRVVIWMKFLSQHETDLCISDKHVIYSSLIAQLRFLKCNLELDIGGNHLIKNIKALIIGGKFFEGVEADEWYELGLYYLKEQLSEQILDDGMHFELSPTYHLQVFADLLECVPFIEDEVMEEHLREILIKMARVCEFFTHPDGSISMFNDTSATQTYSPKICLDVYDRLINARFEVKNIDCLPQAGYFSMRDGDNLLLVDCAPISADNLPAHGHADAFTFELTLKGSKVIVDTGVFEYNQGLNRYYSRSTAAHNTVCLDETDQSQLWSSFRVGKRAKITYRNFFQTTDGFHLSAEHDGYSRLAGAPVHRREFQVSKNTIEVTDHILDGAAQFAFCTLVFHPLVSITMNAKSNIILGFGSHTAKLSTPNDVTILDAYWFPDHGIKISTKKLIIKYGTAPCSGNFKLSYE